VVADDRPDERERVVLRPEAVVLGDDALVEAVPDHFTHELVGDQPGGVLRAGTPVLLVGQEGDRCHVMDGSGRVVEVARSSLRELPGA
jgi:hypothetical protein